MATSRFAWQNFVNLAGVVLSASGSQPTRPIRWAKDRIKNKTWRSPLGWHVVAGFNDKIDFTENVTARVATLTAGVYNDSESYRSMVETAINAAAVNNTYTLTYSTSTRKFTVARDTGATAFDFDWITGPNAATAASKDLGFTADDTGATSYVGDVAVRCSRAYIGLDLLTAYGVKRAAVVKNNLSSSAVLTAQGSATSILAAATAPSVTKTLSGDSDIQIIDFTEETYRYWVFKFDDVDNSDGYVEAGWINLSSYLELTAELQTEFDDDREELTTIRMSDHGSQYRDEKPSVRPYRKLVYTPVLAADKTNLESMAAFLKIGRAFLFTLDSGDVAGTTRYGYLESPIAFQNLRGGATARWRVVLDVREAV